MPLIQTHTASNPGVTLHAIKKIVHCIPSVSEEASGPSYSVVRLCESLLAAGRDTELLALKSARSSPHGSYLRTFPLGVGPRRLGRSPEMYRWLMSRARDGAVQVLHNHSLWMMPNVYAGEVSGRWHIPLIVSPRGTLSHWAFRSGSIAKRFFWPLIQRPAIARAHCFHATSEEEFRDIRAHGFSQPVAIIPNGIDIPNRSEIATIRQKRVLYLGRIHAIKGLDLLLRAWNLIERDVEFDDWTLRVVGPGSPSYLEEFRGMAKSLNVRRLELVGAIYGKDKMREYASASVFVLPSRSENFGMSVAEALAAGTPAIVSKSAPWSGLPAHRAGWWADTSVEGMHEALTTSMRMNESALAEFGARGREWMRRDFGWDRIAEMMSRTYDWVLGEVPTPDWVRL